ncbi:MULTISPECIES: integration host factor, actinobacterial type [unclassified Streptomyces]|uniref:integration host factor, actinobacterial type n=1 Tax=unclassified Streptomyces TaxID=2593676 RepID=UPI0004C906F4|nr:MULTISPECIES: integration host factor, actinobacterial type [unclassified Streptomyces]KOV73396.1 integration host factor [Streptomyces sp. NRRL WC-3723]
MTLPTLTNDDRDAARQKAILTRQARSAVRASLKAGTVTLAQVLNRSDPIVGRMPVRQLLTALPGIGQVRATRSMSALGIPEERRVQSLGPAQRARLLQEFPDAS